MAGHENDLIRVPPRGAVAITLDASASFDPDGSIVYYYWYIYGERLFTNMSTAKPSLTFFLDGANWPTGGGPSVGVLVVDNDGYTAQQHMIIDVEQLLPFGVKVDVGEVTEPIWRDEYPSG